MYIYIYIYTYSFSSTLALAEHSMHFSEQAKGLFGLF